MQDLDAQFLALMAELVVEQGQEYAPARQQTLKMLGVSAREIRFPDHATVDEAVREHLALFYPHDQAQELLVLRQLARTWMQRLSAFRPHLGGTVWRGTATRRSDIYLHLFCDDSKSVEIALIDARLNYDVQQIMGFRKKPVDALSLSVPCAVWNEKVSMHLLIYDHDDLRGALLPDAAGMAHRGGLEAVEALLQSALPLSQPDVRHSGASGCH